MSASHGFGPEIQLLRVKRLCPEIAPEFGFDPEPSSRIKSLVIEVFSEPKQPFEAGKRHFWLKRLRPESGGEQNWILFDLLREIALHAGRHVRPAVRP